MAAVCFNRGVEAERESSVRITLSPRHRNYRAMSGCSIASAAGTEVAAVVAAAAASGTKRRRSWLPLLFERAAASLWEPKFDSEVLESQYWRSSFPQVRHRFQYALVYLLVAITTWAVYLTVGSAPESNWLVTLVLCVILGLLLALILVFTHSEQYVIYYRHVSIATTTLLCVFSLAAVVARVSSTAPALSTVGFFAVGLQVLLVLYTAIPLPLYACVLAGTLYSLLLELLAAGLANDSATWAATPVKLALHAAIHLIGIHMLIMAQVRTRSTFLKVGQSVLVRRDLELDKQLKEKMILSVMPPKVANWLMTEGPPEDEEIEDADGTIRKLSSPRPSSHSPEIHTLFRPFNMTCMKDVSVLFADIVGFTRMSSNKSAETLVGLLNDLFGRFDDLCARHGCEKISTLGDCYYCVSGCPEPRSDHARCCVEMGLSMIRAVKRFDEDTGEDINMRVGVHTGTVLCGIVGTRRFKFDVWSNDVTLANRLESTGRPGWVHISADTYNFLNDEYYVEEGELYNVGQDGFQPRTASHGLPTGLVGNLKGSHKNPKLSMKTYFIIGSKNVIDEIAPSSETWLPTPAIDTSITMDTSQQMDEASGDVEIQMNGIADEEEPGTLSPMMESDMRNKTSLTHSWSTLNSRKDSGIRSRRSSIQAQLMEANVLNPNDFLMGTTASDYYTSSHSSVADGPGPEPLLVTSPSSLLDTNIPLNESLTRFHMMRKQSDLQMIKCIQQDSTHVDYFMQPPISQLTLFFTDSDIESEYRKRAHCQESKTSHTPTLASSTFNTYFDIGVAVTVFALISVSCFALYSATVLWIVFFTIATCWQCFVLLLCARERLPCEAVTVCLRSVYKKCTRWYPWHIFGAFLISLPMVCVLINFSCDFSEELLRSSHFCYYFFVALMHFINFTQLNCWMKSWLATIAGMLFIILLTIDSCPAPVEVFSSVVNESELLLSNMTLTVATQYSVQPHHIGLFTGWSPLRYEAVVSVLLLLLLVWYLNRDFEISYRVSFHGSLMAERDQRKIQMLKDQADWLLHNIIPKHVAEHIKTTAKYSENHTKAAIIFASIVNFNELYDESFKEGRECLRVLNEVISDFDELLHNPLYRNVEKIKTIGSTFMAASGLNPKVREGNAHQNHHLFELMEFAMALQQVLDDFNADLLSFNLIIRIGYNFGDVTAGVIGSTKLLYDLWGDAVNIASRMDSTGVPGRIQVPEHCLEDLEEVFEFEPRGTIFVKGKDNMNVHLLVRKRPGVEYRSPRRSDGAVSHHSVQFSH